VKHNVVYGHAEYLYTGKIARQMKAARKLVFKLCLSKPIKLSHTAMCSGSPQRLTCDEQA